MPRKAGARSTWGDPIKLGIDPEELLVLPATLRCEQITAPRRSDLFLALRQRHDAASSREKRRRREATATRRSEEVLAELLARTGRDAHTSLSSQQQTRSDTCSIALLRAGSLKPAMQHLHKSAEIGLGQAMRIAGSDNSDLDSGVSDWGSGNDADTAAFDQLLHDESRAAMRLRLGSSPLSSPSTSFSSRYSSRYLPRDAKYRRNNRSDNKALPVERPRARATPVGLSKTASGSVAAASTKNSHSPRFKESTSPHQREPAPLSQAQLSPATEKHQQKLSIVEPRGTRDTQPRSAEVQCSGPPIDQAVQTSALLLPRRSITVENRILEAKWPAKALVSRLDRGIHFETGASVEVETQQQQANETASTEPGHSRAVQMHVRARLGGMQDVNRGQQPTIWAVTNGEDSSANCPVIMLPLGREGDEVGGARRYLRVTDFSAERMCKRQNDIRSWHRGHKDRSADVGEREDGEEEEEQKEEEVRWRANHSDLWESLGSLGERLAGMDGRFEELDKEICNDREVIESYQKAAQDEADMAARDLAVVWAGRARLPGNIVNPSLQVDGGLEGLPLALWTLGVDRVPCRRTKGRIKRSVLNGSDFSRMGTLPPSIRQDVLLTGVRDYEGVVNGDEDFDSEGAALHAEQELREARAILQSIDEELASDITADSKSSCAAVTASPAGPNVLVAVPHAAHHKKKERNSRATPQPSPSLGRAGLPASRKDDANLQPARSASGPGRATHVAEKPVGRVSGKIVGSSRSSAPGRMDHTGFGRAAGGRRSVGTFVVHFPTAVVRRRKARGRKTWG